jgi:hypothetical protein
MRLPHDIGFSESGDGKTFLMCMDHGCVTANMQENRAAFEAWALCARGAGYKRVELSASEPPPSRMGKSKR